MNVLITSASRKVALVRTFRDALAAEGGGRVIAADTSPLSAALYEADAGVLVPASDDPAFVGHVLDLCAAHDVRLLVPTRDEELPVFAAHRAAFLDAGVRVMVASPETIARCQDKTAFLAFCVEHGFAVARTLSRDEACEAGEAFVRPRVGKGGVGATRITSPDALDALLRRTPDAIIQEVIDAPEFTIDLFADFDGRLISVVPRHRLRIVAGESYVSRTARVPALMDTAARLAAALQLVGHNTVQCFFDATTPKLIEVNPRYGGAAQLGFAAGACTPRFLVRLAAGKPVDPCVGAFQDGLVMLRFTDDVFLPDGALLA